MLYLSPISQGLGLANFMFTVLIFVTIGFCATADTLYAFFQSDAYGVRQTGIRVRAVGTGMRCRQLGLACGAGSRDWRRMPALDQVSGDQGSVGLALP